MNDPLDRRMVPCPKCDGEGWLVWPERHSGEPEQVQCEVCSGSGETPESYTAYIARLRGMCEWLADCPEDNCHACIARVHGCDHVSEPDGFCDNTRLNAAEKAMEENNDL